MHFIIHHIIQNHSFMCVCCTTMFSRILRFHDSMSIFCFQLCYVVTVVSVVNLKQLLLSVTLNVVT